MSYLPKDPIGTLLYYNGNTYAPYWGQVTIDLDGALYNQPVSFSIANLVSGATLYAEGSNQNYGPNLTFGISHGAIVDRYGALTINTSVSGSINDGTIDVSNPTLMSETTTINVGAHELFQNGNIMSVEGYAPGYTSAMQINAAAGSDFVNINSMQASGSGASINFYAQPLSVPDGAGTIINDSKIYAESGASVSFQGSGLQGYGMVEADNGSRIQVSEPVSGNTFKLTGGSVLEFWQPPKLSFLAPIVADTSDTILIDQAFATHLSFQAISPGLADVKLFDQSNAVVADLHFQGNYNFGSFGLTPHASPSGNWTALNILHN